MKSQIRSNVPLRLNAEARTLVARQLFDADFYLKRYPDVLEFAANPLDHFLQYGWNQNRSPHPLFDVEYYLSQVSPLNGTSAFEHYLIEGWRYELSPHLLFDSSFYISQLPDWSAFPREPLTHFLQIGWKNGLDPHPRFCTQYYLEQNPDVAQGGVNPLVHFITAGAEERRSPHFEYAAHYHVPQALKEGQLAWTALLCSDAVASCTLEKYLEWRYDKSHKWVLDDIRISHLSKAGNTQHSHVTDSPTLSALTLPQFAELLTELQILCIQHEKKYSSGKEELVRPSVSIVLPVHNQLVHTLCCIRSILLAASERYSFEILIANDCSTDATAAALRSLESRIIRTIHSDKQQGFLRNCNTAAKNAQGEWLILLNNDTLVLPDWLDELIDTLRSVPNAGLVGSKLLYPNGLLQESGGAIWRNGDGWNIGRGDDPRKPEYNAMRDVDYCSGAAIAIRHILWENLCGFDERYLPAYYEDTDLAFRVREHGYRTLVQPLSCVIHFEGASHGRDTDQGIKKHQVKNRKSFEKRWRHTLTAHPNVPNDSDFARVLTSPCVLVADACTPTPDQDSGSIDTLQYLKICKKMGYRTIFMAQNALHARQYTRDLQRMGVECWYEPYSPSLSHVIQKLKNHLQTVLAFRYYVAQELLPALRKHAPQAKLIVETVDLHFLREVREAALTSNPSDRERAELTRQNELMTLRAVDAAIVLSQYEFEVLQPLLPDTPLHLIPILRDSPCLSDARPVHERNTLVFLGGFHHPPNLDAILWFTENVWPLLEMQDFKGELIIAGSNMPNSVKQLVRKGIKPVGFVEDLGSLFGTCRATIAPLRYGAGLKGKIISSLSYGVPCITTAIGVEGSGLKHGQEVSIVNSAVAMANEIVRIFKDDTYWEKLSKNGKSYFEEHFSTCKIEPKIINLLNHRGKHSRLIDAAHIPR